MIKPHEYYTAYITNFFPSRSVFSPSLTAASARPAGVMSPLTTAGRAPLCPCTTVTAQAISQLSNEALASARLFTQAQETLVQCQHIAWDGPAAAQFKRICTAIQQQAADGETQTRNLINEIHQWT
ncbi:hypothetical protein [Galliscardovia ingluviei]|nr:hypothetical protein [Galliscardovia ingluviei]